MWDSVQDECQDVDIEGSTDWEMPKWAEGVFVTSGPSKHEMNEQRFSHLFDGFGRFSNVIFKDGKAHFTSKMIKSGFYNRSEFMHSTSPTMLFEETRPMRWTSWIPGLNLFYTLQSDNNWVALELLADNKTFIGTTDTNIKLEMDLMTLETKNVGKWDDGLCATGVSHSKKMSDGTYVSICDDFNRQTWKMDLLVYKLEGANTFKKIEIARIPVERSSIKHAFAMTTDYAIIFDPPWYMDSNLFEIIFMNGQL